MLDSDKKTMDYLSQRALEMIREQIKEGVDFEGKNYEYSTNPFARPLDGTVFRRPADALERDDKLEIFTSSATGKLWVLIKGGYKSYRELTGRWAMGDFLYYTGNMLASMVATYKDYEFTIKFTSEKSSRKAYYLNVAGVGKSRKLWKFLGLSRKNLEILTKEAADMLAIDVKLSNSIVGKIKIKEK